MTATPLTWVVGSGGLLGSNVVALARRRGDRIWSPARRVGWRDGDVAQQLGEAAQRFLADAADGAWQVCWCAGAGVVGSTAADLTQERHAFDALLTALGRASRPQLGSLFVASSAGGVYAGSHESPRDEMTEPRAISPYGQAKLEIEARARTLPQTTGIPVLIGRISNLYGPGQNLAKPQGLISHIARAHLLAQPISIYVPLDTVRDYLFVSDAARLVLSGTARLRSEHAESGPGLVTKVLASQQSVTIGYLVSEFRRITRRRPRVVYGASTSAAFQARDLRLRSRVWTELDLEPLVPLPVGIDRVLRAMTTSLGAGALA